MKVSLKICIQGFTLRRRAAFLHEMDITIRRGSSLYPWETENPFIGWAWKPDWRKWIIGNRSVPAVIMLQRCCCTLPQRWNGMGAGCFFYSCFPYIFPHVVNTVILSSLCLTLLHCPPPFSCFLFLFFIHTHAIKPKHARSAVESFWLTLILPCWAAMSWPSVEWLLKLRKNSLSLFVIVVSGLEIAATLCLEA